MRLSLNGIWECTLPGGEKHRLTVPGAFDTALEYRDTGRSVTYERKFECRESGYARIVFEGVSYACKVWLNGFFLGGHEGM